MKYIAKVNFNIKNQNINIGNIIDHNNLTISPKDINILLKMGKICAIEDTNETKNLTVDKKVNKVDTDIINNNKIDENPDTDNKVNETNENTENEANSDTTNEDVAAIEENTENFDNTTENAKVIIPRKKRKNNM